MLKEERKNIVLELIRKNKSVRIAELTKMFGVSDETVRRDLTGLEKEGLLRCVRGGAVYNFSTAAEPHVELRLGKYVREKEAICRQAAEMVKDGESIAIQASTTALFLGKYLRGKKNLSVVSNSIELANELMREPTNSVILTGGSLWLDEQKTMGELAETDFKKFRVDKAFISVTGISPEVGLTEYNEQESRVTKAVLSSAYATILLNDSSKFDMMAFRKVCDIKQISGIITDWNVSAKDISLYKDMGIPVYVCREFSYEESGESIDK